MSEASRPMANSQTVGLGAILKQYFLRVPPNQREYAWTKREVTTLLTDFAESIQEGGDYFLGTVVTIPQAPDVLTVVDGQQRLATTTVLLAEIRNHLREINEDMLADAIDRILFEIDPQEGAIVPKLTLNHGDNAFFKVFLEGNDPGESRRSSHDLIRNAFKLSRDQVKRVVSTVNENAHRDTLLRWFQFIQHGAQVILLQASSDANAYKMFETLNDRGLKTSQADLVKNYLFGEAGGRLPEAQGDVGNDARALDSLDEDDVTVVFLRYVLMLTQGYLRETEVYDQVQKQRGSQRSIEFLGAAEQLANVFVAVLNPDNERWNSYPPEIRRSIRTLNLLNVKLMRPLMMAVAAQFSERDAAASFRTFIGWEVRFIIAANTRTGGSVELPVTRAATDVHSGKISSADDLVSALSGAVPTDEEFEAEFAVASVSKASLARYYLRAMEDTASGNASTPFFVVNDDTDAINLEHVLPKHPEEHWPDFDHDQVRLYSRRLGNQCLLDATANSNLRNAPFRQKREIYASTPYELTRQISNIEDWGPDEIGERQKTLAEWAVRTWPI